MIQIKAIHAVLFALALSIATSGLTVIGIRATDHQPIVAQQAAPERVIPVRYRYNSEKPSFEQREIGWTVAQVYDSGSIVYTVLGPYPALYQPNPGFGEHGGGNIYFYKGFYSEDQARADALRMVEQDRSFPARLEDPAKVYWTQILPAPIGWPNPKPS